MPKKPISGLKRGLDILGCFDAKRDSLSAKEIAEKMGVPPSTLYRYLDTLLDNGFLARNRESATYRLGFMLLHLGNLVAQGTDLVGIMRPFLKELSERCDESTLLMVLSGWQAVCVAKKETTKLIKLSPQIGLVLPLYAGASSKILLAFQSPSFVDEYLRHTRMKKLTPFTHSTPEKLKAELGKIRKDGYVVSDQEVNLDVAGIAAPVFDANGTVVASVVVAGPSERLIPSKEYFIKNLKEICERASSELGFRRGK
jgi:DNA-binding IclR family transcriptional regulator